MRSLYAPLGLPVWSTGRPFEYYRRIFFDGRGEAEVLEELRGKRVVDVGCGLTPFVRNSMFQACHRAGVEFYGVDPKLSRGFEFDGVNRFFVDAVGGGRMDPEAPGEERRIGALADDMPFDDGSVDLILCCFVLYAWIDDEEALSRIFGEFRRVLRPGGEARIFPTPHYDAARLKSRGLRDVMRGFEVGERFHANLARMLHVPPSFMRRMRRL